MPRQPTPELGPDLRFSELEGKADQRLAHYRELLEQIAVSAPLDDVLHRLVRLIEEQSTDGLIASVLLASPDGMH
ncbi:MAG: hypothetical protein ACRDGH_05410, partial [Candidatus Limnocylindria bacterium]